MYFSSNVCTAILAAASMLSAACTDQAVQTDPGRLVLSGAALLELSGRRDGRVQDTPGGSFQVPAVPIFQTYEPARDTGRPTTIVQFRIAKPEVTPSDVTPSPGSYHDTVHVSVELNSEVLRPPYETSEAETRELMIDGVPVVLTGDNLDCDARHAPPPPPDNKLIYRPLEGRLIARWTVGDQELHLTCSRSVVEGRDPVYLNCGGGTNEETFGRLDFNASEQGRGDCTKALTNLVTPLSYAPRIVEAWRRIAK